MRKKSKILVTGAGGYIGSITSYSLLKKGYNIIALDNFSTGYVDPLVKLKKVFGTKRVAVYKIDLRKNIERVFKKERNIIAVVHFAASCSVNESVENPSKYFFNNVVASQNLISNMVKYNIKNLVYSSTCAVYGETRYSTVDEKHPTNPVNPYGLSKRIAEQSIENWGKMDFLNYVILRYFNVCGASDDGIFGDSNKPSIHLVQNAVRASLGINVLRLTFPTVRTPDKSPIRDYVNVVDIANAHIRALELLLHRKVNEIFNIGTGNGNSVLEIIQKVENITGKKLNVQKSIPRKGEYAKMIASNRKAQRILGWKPQKTLEDSINSLIKWYKDKPRGWSK